MLNNKKYVMAVGISVVLSSYLFAGPPPCDQVNNEFIVTNNSSGWVTSSLKACLHRASISGSNSTVSFSDDMTITLSSPAFIQGNYETVIDGKNNNVIISGGDTTNIFDDNTTHKISLKNLTLSNGIHTDGSDGAVLNLDANSQGLEIENVTFSDNNVSGDSSGGALYIEEGAGNVDINNSHFVRNGAKLGGAIYAGKDINLSINETEFAYNYGISAAPHSKQVAGIYIHSGGILDINNSEFNANVIDNLPGHSGITIHTSDASLHIENSTFKNHNNVEIESSSVSIIYMNSAGDLTINSSSFADNNISILQANYLQSDVVIHDSNFSNNLDTGESSSSLVRINANSLDVNNSKFMNNTTEFGTLQFNGDSLVINNSVFESNSAEVCAGIYADADNSQGTTHFIANTTISNNTAIGGSALCVFNSPAFSLLNSTISENSITYDNTYSQYYSGAILTSDSTLSLESSTIVNNSATSSTTAGIFYYRDMNNGYGVDDDSPPPSTVNLTSTILTNNTDTQDGSQSNANDTLGTIRASLVGSDITASSFTDTIQGLDPRLGSLKNNGGITKTHALMGNSPAIDAGFSAVETDQRGKPRKGEPDMGSYEYQGATGLIPVINYLLN